MSDETTLVDLKVGDGLKSTTEPSNKKLSLGGLFRNGSVMVLECKIWSGTTSLAAEDIGVSNTAEIRDSLNFGTERLVSKDLLSPLVNSRTTAHNLINSYSTSFPFFPGSKFTPSSLADGLETALSGLQKEFYKHVKEVVIPKFKDETEKQLKKTEEALLKATEGKPNSRTIVDQALLRISTKLPDEKTLEGKFRFTWARRSIDFRKDKAFDATLEIMDAAGQETETVKENISAIVTEWSSRVMEIVNNVKEMAAKGSKPTAATIKSIGSLRGKISQLHMFGGDHLVQVLNDLESFIQTNIELQKLESEKATLELSQGADVFCKTLDEVTITAIDEAIAKLSAAPEISL